MTPEQRALLLVSIPLVRIDEKHVPVEIGSGCLFDVQGANVLLTAVHDRARSGDWAIQVAAAPPANAKLHALGALTLISAGHLGIHGLRNIDLAMTTVPRDVAPMAQLLSDTDLTVLAEEPRTVLTLEQLSAPQTDQTYGFAGLTEPAQEEHRPHGEDVTIFGTTPKLVQGLRYTGNRDGDTVFTLPFSHPGHEAFRGCSGAPIMGDHANVVAILTGGCVKTNEVIGIPLLRFRTPMLIEAGKI
jgi:hypothetical protein